MFQTRLPPRDIIEFNSTGRHRRLLTSVLVNLIPKLCELRKRSFRGPECSKQDAINASLQLTRHYNPFQVPR